MAMWRRGVIPAERSGANADLAPRQNASPAGKAAASQPLATLAPFLPDSTFNAPGPAVPSTAQPEASTPAGNNIMLDTSTFSTQSATINPTSTPLPSASTAAPTSSNSFAGLSTAAKAGIIGGSSAVFLAFALTALFLLNRRRHRRNRSARVQRQREKMDRTSSDAADLARTASTRPQQPSGHRSTQSYVPPLPPKDKDVRGLKVTIKDVDSEDDFGPPSPQGGNSRWRRGRERSDTDAATDEAEKAHTRSRSTLAPPVPRHSRTRSTGIDLPNLGPGPTLNEVLHHTAALEAEEDADALGQGYELRRVRSDSDPNLPRIPLTQRSSRTVVLPPVPFAPTWREGVDSARTSVRSWGSWAWPAGKDARMMASAAGGTGHASAVEEGHDRV